MRTVPLNNEEDSQLARLIERSEREGPIIITRVGRAVALLLVPEDE